MRRNYQLLYYVALKCENYRDTGISKKYRVLRRILKRYAFFTVLVALPFPSHILIKV